jgi:hypothetical protein
MPIIKATDKVLDLSNGSVSLTKLQQVVSDVFCINLGHDSVSPTANTYRFGQLYQLAPVTGVGDPSRNVIVPFSGDLVAATIVYSRNATGTSGNCSLSVANVTTGGAAFTITNSLNYFSTQNFNAIYTSFVSSGTFSISAGDTITAEWVVPTLATYPTAIRHSFSLWFKRVLA